MDLNLNECIKIKRLGTNTFYITNDKNYFIKVSKTKKEALRQEYQNLKKIWNNLNIENLDTIEPIDFMEKKGILITRFVNSEPLANILTPKIFGNFGCKLREFHDKGFSHSHLDFTNILYNNGKFILTDLTELNTQPPIHDIIGFELGIKLFQLKRPWHWIKYNKCSNAFLRGYNLRNSLEYYKYFKRRSKRKINKLLHKHNPISKIKGLILIIIFKIGLIKHIQRNID